MHSHCSGKDEDQMGVITIIYAGSDGLLKRMQRVTDTSG